MSDPKTIVFFPLPWTIVHPIESDSPFWGRSADDITRLQAEVMIMVKGFDETFQGFFANRFGSVNSDLPMPQVKACTLFLRYLSCAKIVGEIRRDTVRCLMA